MEVVRRTKTRKRKRYQFRDPLKPSTIMVSETRIETYSRDLRSAERGETIQYIEGTLGIGRDEFNPDYEYRINGTMTSDGENYLLLSIPYYSR
jgi:hypothetical protein